MKKLDLGQFIGILANLGVIAGIIFLGFELHQNNELLNAQARADRRDMNRAAITRKLENPELRRVLTKVFDGEPLTRDEQYLAELEAQAALTDWQYIYLEYQRGFLEEESMRTAGWRRLYQDVSQIRDVWSSQKQGFHPDFVQWFDETIAN